jgi:hypothetical protein
MRSKPAVGAVHQMGHGQRVSHLPHLTPSVLILLGSAFENETARRVIGTPLFRVPFAKNVTAWNPEKSVTFVTFSKNDPDLEG